MSIKLIKCLLNRDFYDKYKHNLSEDFFVHDNNVKGIYHTLTKAYETIESDLTVDSLKELHFTYNPTLTASNKKVIEGIFVDMTALDLTKEVSELVLKKAIEQHMWTDLANLAIQGGDGLKTDFLKAQELFDGIREGITLHNDVKIIEGTIDEMLEATGQQMQWKFHIPTLRGMIDGIGKSTFTLIAARPNVGKTALCTSLIAQPSMGDIGGFLAQGAHVTYIGNEEAAVRTRLRMASCVSGVRREDFYNKEKKAIAQEEWSKVSKNLTVLDMAGYSIEELQKYLKDKRTPIDILVVDVLDKLHIDGSMATEADELYKLYTIFRELLKKHDIAGIGTSQASVDAENREIFGMDCLANSKTGKGGELDVCLCFGRRLDENGRDNMMRTINIPKNKLTGIEDHVTVMIDFPTSRIRA